MKHRPQSELPKAGFLHGSRALNASCGPLIVEIADFQPRRRLQPGGGGPIFPSCHIIGAPHHNPILSQLHDIKDPASCSYGVFYATSLLRS